MFPHLQSSKSEALQTIESPRTGEVGRTQHMLQGTCNWKFRMLRAEIPPSGQREDVLIEVMTSDVGGLARDYVSPDDKGSDIYGFFLSQFVLTTSQGENTIVKKECAFCHTGFLTELEAELHVLYKCDERAIRCKGCGLRVPNLVLYVNHLEERGIQVRLNQGLQVWQGPMSYSVPPPPQNFHPESFRIIPVSGSSQPNSTLLPIRPRPSSAYRFIQAKTPAQQAEERHKRKTDTRLGRIAGTEAQNAEYNTHGNDSVTGHSTSKFNNLTLADARQIVNGVALSGKSKYKKTDRSRISGV